MARNLAAESSGAKVVFSSAWDTFHPPEAVIDGNDSTFWSTTGMFPHEIIITFDSVISVESIETRSFNVKNMQLLKSMTQTPADFAPLKESTIDQIEGENDAKQVHNHEISGTVLRHLKIVLKNGYTDFAGIFDVIVQGENADIKPFG